MDISIILVFAVVFCLSTYMLKRYRNLPPGPFSVPVFGSIFFLKQIEKFRPHLFLAEAAKKYGYVMSFYVGPQLVVSLNGYDTVHEALVKQASVFSGRPGNLRLIKRTFEDDGNKTRGLFNNQYGRSWRFHRRFALQALRDSGVGKSSLEDKVLTEIEAVCVRLESLDGQCLNIKMYLQNIVGNVLNGIVFGRRYEYEDEEFRTVTKLLQMAVSGEFIFSLGNYLPEFVVRLVNRKMADNDHGVVHAIRELRRYVLNHIEDHRATFDNNHIRDLVDLYLKAAIDGSTKDIDTFEEEDIFRVILDLFQAGSDTIATSLDWAVLYMCEYPSIQKACQEEIAEVLGDNPIRYADRLKLVYTEATLLEIQRLSCIVPSSAVHSALEETTLHGYTIPKNALILPSLYSACYDPKYWENPSEFRPERFIGDDGKVIKREAMIPFSTGPRQCVGEPLAKLELFLVFANLLQRFTFEPADKTVKHSMESMMNFFFNSPKPYNIRLYKRV